MPARRGIAHGRNYSAAFNAITGVAAAVQPEPEVVSAELVAEFVESCDYALRLAVDADSAEDVELVVDIDVERPAAMAKAYLLFLAQRCAASGRADFDAPDVDAWFERLIAPTWELLGFERAPSRLTVGLAFSLLRYPEHQRPLLRVLARIVEDFAASGLLRGLPR
jgi:hypothetical protein